MPRGRSVENALTVNDELILIRQLKGSSIRIAWIWAVKTKAWESEIMQERMS